MSIKQNNKVKEENGKKFQYLSPCVPGDRELLWLKSNKVASGYKEIATKFCEVQC